MGTLQAKVKDGYKQFEENLITIEEFEKIIADAKTIDTIQLKAVYVWVCPNCAGDNEAQEVWEEFTCELCDTKYRKYKVFDDRRF